MTKQCTKCKEIKELDLFKKAKSRKDGRCSWCKNCHSKDTVRYQKTVPERVRFNKRNWDLKNPESRKKYKQRRRERERLIKFGDQKIVREFYKKCPKNMVVDHIIPIFGENVSGLTVINNLQYLTKSENCIKANKFED